MKTTTFFFTLLLGLSVSHLAVAQNSKRRNYFPAWTYHQKDINIHGLSVGIGTVSNTVRNTNTNGIKIEAIGAGIVIPLVPRSPVVESDNAFEAIARQPVSERINGISLSATGTVCDCITNGLNLGLIGNINYTVNGITASVFMNFAQKHNGLQLAMFNESYYFSGIQIGVSNYAAKAGGIQIGLGNFGRQTKGIQIGLLNKTKNLKGLQFGLWNVNGKRKLPIINWQFKSKTQENK
jgi:hypothetical protein